MGYFGDSHHQAQVFLSPMAYFGGLVGFDARTSPGIKTWVPPLLRSSSDQKPPPFQTLSLAKTLHILSIFSIKFKSFKVKCSKLNDSNTFLQVFECLCARFEGFWCIFEGFWGYFGRTVAVTSLLTSLFFVTRQKYPYLGRTRPKPDPNARFGQN